MLHGVDATRLDREQLGLQDLVLWNFPHLGLNSLGDEGAHALRHSQMLAHFFHSGQQILREGGIVSVTLCGSQAEVWSLDWAAQKGGLCCCSSRPCSETDSLLPGTMPWSYGRQIITNRLLQGLLANQLNRDGLPSANS